MQRSLIHFTEIFSTALHCIAGAARITVDPHRPRLPIKSATVHWNLAIHHGHGGGVPCNQSRGCTKDCGFLQAWQHRPNSDNVARAAKGLRIAAFITTVQGVQRRRIATAEQRRCRGIQCSRVRRPGASISLQPTSLRIYLLRCVCTYCTTITTCHVRTPQIAEGQTRMFETIRLIAVKEDKACHGVWASFGKPYVCLGEPTEVGGSTLQSHHTRASMCSAMDLLV